MEKFVGKWKSTKMENFDNFMKAMNVGFVLRKAGSMATVYLDYQVTSEGVWTIDWQIAFKSGTVRFRLGEEVETVTPDDRKIRMVPTFEEDKYCEMQRGKPHDVRLERWIDENGDMQEIVTIIGENAVSSSRTYVRY